jgi:hypothetical protein
MPIAEQFIHEVKEVFFHNGISLKTFQQSISLFNHLNPIAR